MSNSKENQYSGQLSAGTQGQQSSGTVISGCLQQDSAWLDKKLAADQNFDVVTRTIEVGGREAALYFIDGFCKDDLLQKLLQYFMDMKAQDMPGDAAQLLKKSIPYIEVDQEKEWEKITSSILSGIFVLLVDGYREAVLIDARSYPSRSVEEPEKDKVLRGSKDGFVETVVFNTALIRRRIRDTDLRMEMMSAGKSSKTDIVLCYMDSRVDHDFLEEIKQKIQNIRVDSLTMKQESLAECVVPGRWWNPFP
ncbi:MAG: spore germination protein, partial [Acetatifactor sp.]|nr:spore germination protein [Acetatifactor sp.]